ncbi:MAG TPA: hypothetical protein VNR68_08530 [Sphingomicrobium sp.]|nr:hypothetical protein [Sphingomicrobium sp.]
MSFGSPAFVLAIIAMSYAAWLITSWIRAKHGYPIENEWGGSVHPLTRGDDDTTRALKAENEQLRNTVGQLEERLKVLERIATDPSRKLADEIENLR